MKKNYTTTFCFSFKNQLLESVTRFIKYKGYSNKLKLMVIKEECLTYTKRQIINMLPYRNIQRLGVCYHDPINRTFHISVYLRPYQGMREILIINNICDTIEHEYLHMCIDKIHASNEKIVDVLTK